MQQRKDSEKRSPKMLLQLSAAGEVFLEGTCPLSRCPQTAKLPAPCFWRTGKVGEKSDSFSRAERTRPLRPAFRLPFFDFGNVPVERFQRILPLLKSADTAQPVPTMCTEHLANCAQLDQPFRGQFPESALFSHVRSVCLHFVCCFSVPLANFLRIC